MFSIRGGRFSKSMTVAVAAMMLFTTLAVLNFTNETSGDTWEDGAFVVTTGDDDGPGSLRAALALAKDGDTILIDPSVKKITLLSEISFTQSDITINGGAGVIITKELTGAFRLLKSAATSGTLTLKGLNIENGKVSGNGGGVLASGNVVLINCNFTKNEAVNGGGLHAANATISNSIFAENTASNGGGVYSSAKITMTESTFIGNSANNGGGIFSAGGAVTLTNCVFTGNAAEYGGAAYTAGNITLKGCGFAKNETSFGTVYSSSGMATADNTSFFANVVSGDGTGVVHAAGVTLRHCTFTNNMKPGGADEAFNIFVDEIIGTISVENCLMTQDSLTGNINGAWDITAGNLLGTDGTSDYTAWFGINTLTFNYIMPLPGIAGGATTIASLYTDAAGNTRTGSCLYGAVNWTAMSWVVTNSNDGAAPGPTGSLRWCVNQAETYSTAPLPDKRVVYFDGNTAFDIKLTSGQISYTKDIMIIGRLGSNGEPDITVDARSASRAFYANIGTTSITYYYGLNILNGKVSATTGAGIHSAGGIYADHCFFKGNVTTGANSSGGAIYCAYTAILKNCIFIDNSTNTSGGGVYSTGGGTSAVNLIGCIFVDNYAATNGGGVSAGSIMSATDSVFINNKSNGTAATSGGGGTRSAGSTIATGCLYIGNSAASYGGGMYSGGNPTTLTECIFIENEAASSGGGAYVASVANVTGCKFIGNAATNGGGMYTSGSGSTNYLTMTNCVFTGNTASVGSGLNASVGPLLMISNSTFNNNEATTNSGAIDCSAKTYLFHVTVTDNKGIGVFLDAAAPPSSYVYLYNSIVVGNTDISDAPMQTSGNVNFTSGNNKVDGVNSVTALRVFGLNEYDSASGTFKVLSNGIAAKGATALSMLGVYTTGLTATQITYVTNAVANLAKDQTGVARPTSGNVTFGAVETAFNSLESIAVTADPTKTTYSVGDSIDLTGTELTFTFTNGIVDEVPYSEPGLTNTSSSVDTTTVGSKQIDFTFLGVSTTPTGVNVKVTDGTSIILTSGDPTAYGEEAEFIAQVVPDNLTSGVPTGTVTFYNGAAEIGTATLDSGIATLRISDLPAGDHSITAVYEGDTYYGGSTSSALAFTIAQATGGGSISVTGWTYGETPNSANVTDTNEVGFTIGYKRSTDIDWIIFDGDFPILNAGIYDVRAIFDGTGNFAEFTATSSFEVQKVKLTVTADDKSRLFGQGNPDLTYNITGFVYEEDETFISGGEVLISTLAIESSPPGGYAITISGSLSADNYTFEYVDGELTVTQAQGGGSIIVAGWTYGDTPNSPNVSDTNEVGYTVWYKLSTDLDWMILDGGFPTLNAGNYDVRAVFDGTGSFEEFIATSSFDVLKAKLSVTADDKSRLFGQANPTLTYTITGYVYEEDETVISEGEVLISTLATASSPPGGYAITTSGSLSADNYTFEYVDGELTVIQATEKVYHITATSDGGSTITPGGVVTLSVGSSQTFVFAAKDGFTITEVTIDGHIKLSQAQINSGSFTFTNVTADHTIEVKTTAQTTSFTLSINIAEGKGYAEYSVNGSAFVVYVSTVTLEKNSSLVVRAHAADGYSFNKWETPSVETSSSLTFNDVRSSIHLELFFAVDDSGAIDDGGIQLRTIGSVLLIVLFAFTAALLIRRRKEKD